MGRTDAYLTDGQEASDASGERCTALPAHSSVDEGGDLLGRAGYSRAVVDITVGYVHDSLSVSVMSSVRGVLKAMLFAAGTHP